MQQGSKVGQVVYIQVLEGFGIMIFNLYIFIRGRMFRSYIVRFCFIVVVYYFVWFEQES